MRSAISSLMLWGSVIVGELHNLFPDGPEKYNWIMRNSIPMTLNWNVWFVGVNTQMLMLMVAVRYWQRNKHNIITLRVFTYFMLVDYFLYFYNWKTVDYGYVYLWMIGAYFLQWYWKKNNRLSMAQAGTIDKPIQMNKPTPWIGTAISIIALIGALIGFWMNLSAEIATLKANRENDRLKYDERYIEQRDANREIKNLLQDMRQEQYNQRVLIEQKQNRK